LNNVEFSEDKASFYADDCAVELAEDGNSYTIKSMNDERSIVNVKITKAAPGFKAGETGTTKFGTDLENPWGVMRHAFWPRCTVEGTITTPDGPIDFKGRALYSYAIQGMKPHHAAARWNFADFQGPNYSAILMEFTTPPSYGTTKVIVGGIVKDGEIIAAGCDMEALHTTVTNDAENEWPEPSHVKFVWSNKDKDGKPVEAIIEGSLGDRVDRVDVMAEVPGFVKKIVAGAAGTKPYIYQVRAWPQPHFTWSLLTRRLVFSQGYSQAESWRRRNQRRGSDVYRGHVHLGSVITVIRPDRDSRAHCSSFRRVALLGYDVIRTGVEDGIGHSLPYSPLVPSINGRHGTLTRHRYCQH